VPCYPLKNGIGFICARDGNPHCRECAHESEFLCDYPVGDGKTCDAPLCDVHAHEVGLETHYCTAHHAEWLAFVASGGVKRELENVIPYKQQKPKKQE
jgi:hypothetical protein